MSNFKKLKLNTKNDERGSLTVIENALPFTIKRCYWIYDTQNVERGGHRHKSTIQALVCIKGEILIYMQDSQFSENILLNSPDDCLIVEPKDWHTMNFKEGSILLVLASEKYDADDYVYERY
jgi:dTDP-4-dehydrorhamnose 3,5-epimerase-like enzyme